MSYNKLNHGSVEKLPLISGKIQLVLWLISQTAATHRSFLSSGDDSTNLSTVRPELTEREANTKTSCKHKPRQHFPKLEMRDSNPVCTSCHRPAPSDPNKFLKLQKLLGRHTQPAGLCKILSPSGDSTGKLAEYIWGWLVKLSLRLWQLVILRYSRVKKVFYPQSI